MRSSLQATQTQYAMLAVCFLTLVMFVGTAIAGGGIVIMPGSEGGMIMGGPLNGTVMPGSEGGMVIGGPLNGTVMPGSEGGMVMGGPLNGTIVAP
jgi:hypothetical protein